MASKAQLIDAYAEWLSEWDWDVFGTLTFPGYPSKTTAEIIFDRWISEIELEAGARDFRYVRVLERGAFGDNNHFHVLIGGIKGNVKQHPFPLRARWQELAGNAAIVPYDPDKGGIRYLLKTLLPDRDFDIALNFRESVRRKKKAA